MTVTQLTTKAGKARMQSLSATERQALARKGAHARAAKLSHKQRSDSARKAAQARWLKCKTVDSLDIPTNTLARKDVDVTVQYNGVGMLYS